jgi:hypothetical protein
MWIVMTTYDSTTTQPENNNSQTNRYSMKYLLRIAYVMLFLIALASIFTVAGHVVIPKVWHWRNGNSAIFQQFAVPVPPNWWAFYAKDGGLIVQRLAPLYQSGDTPAITVGVFRWPSDRPYDALAWRRVRIETISAHGYHYYDSNEFYVGEHVAYCLQFKGLKDLNDVRGVCDIPSAHLSFDFMGPSYGWSEFYPIVRGTKAGGRTSAPL